MALGVSSILALSACGGSSGNSLTRYHDKTFGFSIALPKGWTAPKKGALVTGIGYTVHFVRPSAFQIVVGPPLPVTHVANGKITHGGACLATCTFYRIQIHHRPALFVKITRGRTVLEEDVDVDAGAKAIELQYAAAAMRGLPGLSSRQQAQLLTVASTLILPK